MIRIVKTLDRQFDNLLSATGAIGGGIMLLLSVLVFLLSFSRYVLRVNVAGLFDMAVYSMVIFSFITAAYTMKQGQHITVDVLTALLAERTQAILNITTYSVALIYIIILGWHGWLWSASLFRRNISTEAILSIPQFLLIFTLVLGCFLLILQMIRVLVGNIRSLPGLASSSGLKDNPWLYVSVFLIGIIAGTVLLTSVSPAVGLIVLTLVVLFSGMPIFLALGFLGILGIYFFLGPTSLIQTPITAYRAVYSFPLTSLPLFILGGLIMEKSGIIEDIFRFFELMLGRFAVSPLLVTLVVGMVFCAISGSSTAVTAVIAGLAMPVLLSRNYSKSLSSGVVGGSTVGTLIPPSIGYVVYCVLTGNSISEQFMAGIIPSVILFGFYFLYVAIRAVVNKKSLFENGEIPSSISAQRVTWKDRALGLKTGVWGLLTPVLILGGIYFGVYTPTEAAGILVVYAIVVSIFIKGVKWKDIMKATSRGVIISSMIVCIIFSAYIFAVLIAQTRIAANFVEYAEATGMTANMVLAIIFVFLIVLGFFLEGASLKVITLPIFYPLATAVGINPLWLGVFYQFLGEIGLLTPPVGLNLFVIRGVTGLPLITIVRGNFPFILMMLLTVAIIYIFPELVTWLPQLLR
ncbi:TRAP transporter large permease subunit [Chloroflexota bacterium]